jgi:hypothetical protein
MVTNYRHACGALTHAGAGGGRRMPATAQAHCGMPRAMCRLSPRPQAHRSRGRSFRIATMDRAAEEAEIRRALDGLPGIRRPADFRLGQSGC